jgi:3-methylcrotonyl-CoA carboxylase alpha subunit
MKRILIANRGEIAVRIIKACREMGISPVAVYSEADRSAMHATMADAACPIGPSAASESYLRIDNILDAARATGADAIHPGYGFLSENAAFAKACADGGIVFIGPTAEVMNSLGDKIHAKQRMVAAGVPVVPGYYENDQSDSRLTAEARNIGAPLLIKAASGGGGRGMRRVDYLSDFLPALDEARREADAAFGDPRVLLEKYIDHPRHIEVQIFGDSQGNVIHLFERECSIQRRHQKIIEESPSPVLTKELRDRITNAAVIAGKAARYINAGTVEFLFEERPDGNHQFYFLEVNTRLQVEHPVTELLTGIDLVKLQIRIAAGEPLPNAQCPTPNAGHAMEVRIYAEDPGMGFLPSVGKLAQWIEPKGPWIRVDSGFQKGDEVSSYYDPMLAKLIVRGENREDALARMEQALLEFQVLGVRTNISYLLAIIRHPEFKAGSTHTAFLDQYFKNWKPEGSVPEAILLALAAEASARPPTVTSDVRNGSRAFDPWTSISGWRNTEGDKRATSV